MARRVRSQTIPSQRSGAKQPSHVIFGGKGGLVGGLSALKVYADGEWLCIGVRVKPGAQRTGLTGAHGERLKLTIKSPPEDNRANKELETTLAAWAGLERIAVKVVRGHTSRDKVVAFRGLDEVQLRHRLAVAMTRSRI